jgi:acetyl-CoA carboxylase biotin carboxyl carrier protein
MTSTDEEMAPVHSDEPTDVEVEQILAIVRDHSFDYVDVRTATYRVTVARGALSVDEPAVMAEPPSPADAAPPTPVAPRMRQGSGRMAAASTGGINGLPPSQEYVSGHAVRSPIMGVFYRAPSASEPAFVDVGTVVQEGDTLGLVEVMKTFAPVTADVTGTVLEVLAQDAARIEPGQVLFVIEQG